MGVPFLMAYYSRMVRALLRRDRKNSFAAGIKRDCADAKREAGEVPHNDASRKLNGRAAETVQRSSAQFQPPMPQHRFNHDDTAAIAGARYGVSAKTVP